jgi:predicted permease
MMVIVIVTLSIIMVILAWLLRPKNGTFKTRRVAILTTTIPLVGIAIAALIFQLIQNSAGGLDESEIANTLFIIGSGLMGVAILLLLGFVLARKGEIAKGIGFGLTIVIILYIIEFVSLEVLMGV